MQKGLLVLLGVFGGLPLFLAPEEPLIRRIDFDQAVTQLSSDFLIQAIDQADQEGAELILIRLDTPGGYVSSMEPIIQKLLSPQTKTTTVAWVGPAGARAASAGFLILISADVAAMAPGTHTGAASPISAFGANPKGDIGLEKAAEDMAARARTIAEHRGRNVFACEQAVRTADAYTNEQAVKEGIINLVAKDEDELLQMLDGKEVKRFDGSTKVLRTKGARIFTSKPSLGYRILSVLANPLVAYALMSLGILGLWVELSHPGMIFPGVVGVLCLLLFAYSASILETSVIGILLIILSIVLFILEIKVTSYGMLTFGGILCLLLGSLMLFQGPIPELQLSLGAVLPGTILIAAACTLVVRLAVRAHQAQVSTGKEGLDGQIGKVVEELNPEGKVFIHGELWDAVSTSGTIGKGTRIRVVGVEELELLVEPEEARHTEGG